VSRWLAHLEDGASRPGVRFTAYREPRSPVSDPGDDAATAEAEDADDRASARGKDSPLDDANPIAILEGLHVSNRRASVGDSNTETAVEDTDTVVSRPAARGRAGVLSRWRAGPLEQGLLHAQCRPGRRGTQQKRAYPARPLDRE
jgi:hypothetical protein